MNSDFKQTWTNWCVTRIRYIEAWFRWCCIPPIPILRETTQELYILPSYRYNQQIYTIPVKIEKDKTMTFVRACIIQPTLDGKEEEGHDLTERMTQFLGPNQDFHKIEISPLMIGYPSIRLYFIDTQTLDVISRTFHQHEPMVLEPVKTFTPPSINTMDRNTDSPFDIPLSMYPSDYIIRQRHVT